MGLSSNQARFLSLTSRQVDLEHRIQQICQRRLRLTSELENVATTYNNSISNRKLFTPSQAGIDNISLKSLDKLGYKVINTKYKELVQNIGTMNKPLAPSSSAVGINSEQDFLNLINIVNSGTPAEKAAALAGNYVLNTDIDLSDNGTFNKAVFNGYFTGTFDGQGHSISGASITANTGAVDVGIFAGNTGTIKNLAIDDAKITSAGTSGNYFGVLVGTNSGTIDNVGVANSDITVGSNYNCLGGLAGRHTAGSISNSYADTDITAGTTAFRAGGLVGDITGNISNSYATGDIIVGDNSNKIAGFGTSPDPGNNITNCYSTGDVTTGINCTYVGGFLDAVSGAIVRSSYTTGNVTAGTGSTSVGGFAGAPGSDGTTADNSNFYKNNMTPTAGNAVNENVSPSRPQDLWSPSVWDFSKEFPILMGTNDGSDKLEEGLRNGTYSLVKDADEFSQNPLSLDGEQYEEVDWRSTPEIYDELNKGDDVDAENKYDKTIEEINTQDKKLQLEQTTIEVEYKAISSEKEAVKKILDTNAQSSFKYFS